MALKSTRDVCLIFLINAEKVVYILAQNTDIYTENKSDIFRKRIKNGKHY